MAFRDQHNLSKVECLFNYSNSYFLELRTYLNILIWILQVSKLYICKFCIREQKYFLLCVHMAIRDQHNLSKVECLFNYSNSYFLELRTYLNILIWILQVSKLLLGESTYVSMHML